jgi:DnaJ-class molecular chaperone
VFKNQGNLYMSPNETIKLIIDYDDDIDFGDYEVCPSCDGFGEDENDKECKNCGGSGEILQSLKR